MGDLVIVTLEGDDPARSFGQLMAAKDAFTTWFIERVKAVHGVDLDPLEEPGGERILGCHHLRERAGWVVAF